MSAQTLTALRTPTIRTGLVALLAVLIVIVAFDRALFELVRRWIAEEEYSHGFLIPVVSTWMLWMRRDALDERGRQVANDYLAKWYLLADAITKNRTDGSLICLTTQVFPGETERDADKRLQSFMRDVVPALAGYLPSEQNYQPKSALSHSNRYHR